MPGSCYVIITFYHLSSAINGLGTWIPERCCQVRRKSKYLMLKNLDMKSDLKNVKYRQMGQLQWEMGLQHTIYLNYLISKVY